MGDVTPPVGLQPTRQHSEEGDCDFALQKTEITHFTNSIKQREQREKKSELGDNCGVALAW